jgi:hypothetical protein
MMDKSLSAAGKYGFAAPTEEDVVNAIAKYRGELFARNQIARGRMALDLNNKGRLNLEEIELLAGWMTMQTGPLCVSGHSLIIRLRSYRHLSRLQAAMPKTSMKEMFSDE